MIRKWRELYPLIHCIFMSFAINILIISVLHIYYVYLPMI